MRRLAFGLAALALVAAACGGSGGGATETTATTAPAEGGTTTAAAAAACTEEHFTSMGQDHTEEPPPEDAFNSFPPTSGPHHPTAAIWNAYDEEIPQFVLVHNLEHGGIVVQYGDQVPAENVDAIRDWWKTDPRGIIVAPYAALGDRVAVGAWTHLLTCTGFDEEAVTAFRDEHRFKGPELLAEDTYEPGN